MRAKIGLWSGLIAKDLGDLESALAAFDAIPRADDLDAARVAFQRGDVFMNLGHFDRALAAMNNAVALARGSEALVAEQTRYLARRGTVHRRMGDLDRAFADFDEARHVLLGARPDEERRRDSAEEADRDFWLARVDDEAGLACAGRGSLRRRDVAFAATCAFPPLRRHPRRRRDVPRPAQSPAAGAGVRLPRGRPAVSASLRHLAALGGTGPDLRHARDLIGGVLDHIDATRDGSRPGSLARDTLLAANLFAADGAAALAAAERALAGSRYPYQREQAHAHAAGGALRSGDPDLAERHLAQARSAREETASSGGLDERGDLELEAWLYALDAFAAIHRGDVAEAAARVSAGLRRPELGRYHTALLQQYGDAVEERDLDGEAAARLLAALVPIEVEDGHGALRLADALVAGWRGARDAPGDGGPRRATEAAA